MKAAEQIAMIEQGMTRKPNTSEAMRNLINEVRTALPLHISALDVCADECRGCSVKLIEYITMELETWEYRLDDGDIPNFGDLTKLARSSRKIYGVLAKNGLIEGSIH